MLKKKIHLIMPMGGAGSRFFKNGYVLPKPLIEINGKPFLYWSTLSIAKFVDVLDLTFVVLKEHIEQFGIDKKIKQYFGDANIVVIPEVLPGAVMTCLAGIEHISDDNPVLFNDCDHMFKCSSLNEMAEKSEFDFDGGLLTFESNQPQFSYVKYDDSGKNIIGTVEKQVVSNHAICGAYLVKNAELFRDLAEDYLKQCQYSEYFVSGIYNVMCQRGLTVKDFLVDFHLPFGTPDEYKTAKDSQFFEIFQ